MPPRISARPYHSAARGNAPVLFTGEVKSLAPRQGCCELTPDLQPLVPTPCQSFPAGFSPTAGSGPNTICSSLPQASPCEHHSAHTAAARGLEVAGGNTFWTLGSDPKDMKYDILVSGLSAVTSTLVREWRPHLLLTKGQGAIKSCPLELSAHLGEGAATGEVTYIIQTLPSLGNTGWRHAHLSFLMATPHK